MNTIPMHLTLSKNGQITRNKTMKKHREYPDNSKQKRTIERKTLRSLQPIDLEQERFNQMQQFLQELLK